MLQSEALIDRRMKIKVFKNGNNDCMKGDFYFLPKNNERSGKKLKSIGFSGL